MAPLLAALLILALSLAFLLLRNFNRWWYEPRLKPTQAPLPPGQLGWPIIGTMLHFFRAFKSDNPQTFIGSYIDKYQRIGVYRAFLFGQPTVLATTPEACKLVLMNDDLFSTHWPKSTQMLMGRKSFTSIGPEEHKRLRRLTAAALAPDALQKYLPRVDKFAKEALEQWATQDQLSFLLELKKFTFSVVANIFLSYEPGPKSDALEREYQSVNRGVRAMAINIPGTAYRKALKSRARLVALLQKAIDERKAAKAKKGDVLEALMEAVDDSGNYLTDEEIIDVLVMYLNAGHESSAHTTMWITIFFQRNPQIWKKVQMEQLDIQRRKKPNELLTMNDIREMKYLAKAIDETLRIVNIAPMVFRKALRDVEFRGYTIPKGWTVEPWLRQVHLDPEVHPEPLKFNPDRWDNFVPRPGTFIPFGMGSRLCPGNLLAIMEVSVFIHHMALSYRLEPVGPLSRIIYLPHPRPENNYPVKIRRADDNKGIACLH